MTDLDVMTRVGTDLGRAVVAGRPRHVGYRVPYAVTVKGADAVRLMVRVRGELSSARKRQIDAAIRNVVLTPSADHECSEDEQLWWLAGLLEGEGCFSMTRADGHSYPVLALKMVSREIVEKAARMLATTNVHAVPPRDPAWRVTVRASISGAAAAMWMQRLRPLLGERRRAAIDAVLDRYYPIRLTEAPSRCCVPGCAAAPRGRGLCHKHYMSWLRDCARGKTPRVRPLRSN